MNTRPAIHRVSRLGVCGRMADTRRSVVEHNGKRMDARREAAMREAIGHPAPVTASPPTYCFLRN